MILRFSGALALVLISLFVTPASAQVQLPENIAPPPVRVLSKEEKKALEALTDHKARTKLTLDLMEARLRKAEELGVAESYAEAVKELAGFQALMNNAMQFLQRNNDGRGSILNTFKRFELALRGFSPRIETIRREAPERFEYHVREILRGLRDARSSAVEPLFGNTVLPTGN
jgi:DNA repair ATPase RecN